jgi:hypothetical protein
MEINIYIYIPLFMIINCFGNQHPYNKVNFAQHTKFLEDLVLYIAKGYMLSIFFVENLWTRCMFLKYCLHVVFSFQHQW